MIRSAAALLVLTSAAVIGSCTAPPAGTPAAARANGSQCFLANEVNSFSPSNAGFVDVRVGATRYFRLDLGGGCPDINWSMSVGIRAVGGGSFICQGYDAELIVPDPSGTQHCPIARITPITKEQFLATEHR